MHWLDLYLSIGQFPTLNWTQPRITFFIDSQKVKRVCVFCFVRWWWDGDRDILHSYAHDDVSTGSWFVGLDVKHVDEGKFCCSAWSSGNMIYHLLLNIYFCLLLASNVKILDTYCLWHISHFFHTFQKLYAQECSMAKLYRDECEALPLIEAQTT